MKKRLALILALALTLALSACVAKTPAEAVAAAQKKMTGLKSMDAVVSMDMGISMGEEAVSMVIDMSMSTFTDPEQAKIDMTIDLGEQGSQEMSLYMRRSGDAEYTLYMTDGVNWYAQSVPLEDVGQYNAQGSADLYLSSAAELKSAGAETLPGGAADKYTGVIKGESIQEVVNQTGVLSSLDPMLGDIASAEDIMEGMGDLPVTIWLDQATGYPARYSMDMSGMMGRIMEKALAAAGASEEESGGVSIDRCVMVMEFKNFDNATPFTIPQEALGAEAA